MEKGLEIEVNVFSNNNNNNNMNTNMNMNGRSLPRFKRNAMEKRQMAEFITNSTVLKHVFDENYLDDFYGSWGQCKR